MRVISGSARGTKLVSIDDILANDANLSVSSYVEQEDTREKINIKKVNIELYGDDKNPGVIAEVNRLRAEAEKIVKELSE